MELFSCCRLLSFLHTGFKRCLNFSNADSDKLINISWMDINKQNTKCLCCSSEDKKQFKALLVLVTSSLYKVKISFFTLYMAISHPQNWKDKWDTSNIKKYLMVSAFIIKEKSYWNQPFKQPEISRIFHSPLQTASQLLQMGGRCWNIKPLYSTLSLQYIKKLNRSSW